MPNFGTNLKNVIILLSLTKTPKKLIVSFFFLAKVYLSLMFISRHF